MDFRKTLEKYRSVTIPACVACVLVAVIVAYATLGGRGGNLPGKVYFTVDDGATWFAASRDKLPPFQEKGRDAVRVHVFNCDGNTVPGYLERLSASAHETLTKARGDPEALRKAQILLYTGTEVKALKGDKWVPRNSPEGRNISMVPCQNAVNPEEIFP
jgi:hypothetical protein